MSQGGPYTLLGYGILLECGCSFLHRCPTHQAQYEQQLELQQQVTKQNIAAELSHEQQMADTVAVGSDEEVRLLVAANNALRKDNVVLTKRIEELESVRPASSDEEVNSLRKHITGLDFTIYRLRDRHAELEKENVLLARGCEELKNALTTTDDQIHRIAAVLKTFYYAEHSLSSMQPIIALCLELNPEIVEHKR